jgi:HEPN domain-containing protein
LFKNGNDEGDINIACYHCQQAVEKLFALSSQNAGIKPIRSHDLEEWEEFADRHSLYVPNGIRPFLEEITKWEYTSRYNINFAASKKKLNSVYELCIEWLRFIERRGKAMDLL